MTEHFIKTKRTARIYTMGELNKSTKTIWIALHGYGQLPAYFLRRLTPLNDGESFIIAPEGLSRFYVDGMGGKVGASWMTKEDREHEIEDQKNYLDSVVNHFKLESHGAKINLLGFSQGTATASRWLAGSSLKFANLILWSGGLAHDLELEILRSKFQETLLHFVIGNQDEFIKPEQLKEQEELLKREQLVYTMTAYQGGHQIDKEVLFLLKNRL